MVSFCITFSAMGAARPDWWAVVETGSVLILVHDDIKPPVQSVFDAPVGADDLGGLGGGFCRGLANAVHPANGAQAGAIDDRLATTLCRC